MSDYSFEKLEKEPEERELPPGQDFEASFKDGVPEFTGEWAYGSAASPSPERYDTIDAAIPDGQEDLNYDRDAAAIIGYGLDAVSRRIGVEQTVQLIKNFDATGSDNPIKDLYEYMGINTSEEFRDVSLEAGQAKPNVAEFREESGMPVTARPSKEGALKAIEDMKELISEVETSPRYTELRAGARSAGKGYFDYAVQDYSKRGLTELFTVLAEQKEESPDGKSVEQLSSPETDNEKSLENLENRDAPTEENQEKTENVVL